MRHALLLSLAALVSAAAGGCSLDLQDETVETTTTIPVDDGPVRPPTIVGAPVLATDLIVGDCFNEYHYDDPTTGDRVDVISLVGCGDPHDGEVFYFGEYPAPFGTPYPGDDAMRRYAQGTCYQQFEPFVGILYELSELQIGVVTPNQINFEDEKARYRGITCTVTLPGEKLIGTTRNTEL